MSKTDQAFIDAYRRRPEPPVDGERGATQPSRSYAREQSAPGPHVRFNAGGKTPLSQVMRAQAEQAAPHPAAAELAGGAAPAVAAAPRACTRLANFRWPETVRLVAEECADALAAVVDGVERFWPVLGVAGCRPGSGGTTIVMATARLLASQGAPVAVIDADPNVSDLARQLGVMHHQTIADVLAGGAPLEEATLHAVDDGVSLLVAGPLTQHPALVGESINRLRETHAAVLIDLGTDPRRVAIRPDAVVLVHASEESEAVVEYSSRSLRQAGVALVGAVENLAPAA